MHQIGAVYTTVAVRVPTGLRPAPEPRPPLPGWASATNLERRLLVFFSSPQHSLDPWAPESQVRLPHTPETCGRGGGCSIPSVILTLLLLQPLPFCDSNLGSRSGYSSPLPSRVVPSFLSREEVRTVFSRRLASTCAYTRYVGAFLQRYFHTKQKNTLTRDSRSREIGQ